MCVTCGCGNGSQTTFTRPQLPSETDRPPDHLPPASPGEPHRHTLADGTVITHHHGPSSSPGITLTLEQAILGKNDQIAAENRDWLRDRAIAALNLVSGPGAGKTTLLVKTLQDLQGEMPLAVIEGDQATSQDGDRVAATGCPTLQVNTGKGCHLEAAMVQRGLHDLNPPDHGLVMIENVGNLVCPALFDLGERAKVALLSVTEGEDKPIKYPHLFRASQVLVLTKIDLLPYVPFDRDRCLAYARQVNPDLTVFQVSALSGAGLGSWYDWLRSLVQ
jgi:hydrogenase nickel incorporation protein HypB